MNDTMNTEIMNVGRDKDIAEVVGMIAKAKRKFHSFARGIHDEELEEMCQKVSSAMVTCITELTELDNYVYTLDVVNWAEGDTVSTIAKARV